MSADEGESVFLGKPVRGVAYASLHATAVYHNRAFPNDTRLIADELHCILRIECYYNKVAFGELVVIKLIIYGINELCSEDNALLNVGAVYGVVGVVLYCLGNGTAYKSESYYSNFHFLSDPFGLFFWIELVCEGENTSDILCNIVKGFRCQRLSSVAECVCRIVVNFYYQSVGACGSSGECHGLDKL